MLKRYLCFLFIWVSALASAEPLTLPREQRPDWLTQDGIVMAGSWEPLLFRVRRDGSEGYTPTPEQIAATKREHSPEMVAQLKNLGVNFVMMHCYKGFGLKAEAESMNEAVRFSKLCHDSGLRIGVYNYSGAFGWELFFKEVPEARDWVVLDREGKPVRYGSTTYRYYWNRNHPGAQAFYKNLIRFAVRDIKTDLLHFDNYSTGPGMDANSVERFRDYLEKTFTPSRLERMGVTDVDTVLPPMDEGPKNPLCNAWLKFVCDSLTESYHEMGRYGRGLRKDILVECNPGGVRDRIAAPIDHGKLLLGGEAFWDEGRPPGYRDKTLYSRIRTYKVARRMENMAFAYTTKPLEMAESMAFNLDCLGCVCWFEYGKLAAKPGSNDPVSPQLPPYIRFFKKRRELFRDAGVVADAAVLRSFSSQVFADAENHRLTAKVEQALIENRVPFQIIYDYHLNDLKQYRFLVLAGCPALSDGEVNLIVKYTEEGGTLIVTGPAATHDEWMNPRPQNPFGRIQADKLVSIIKEENFIDAFREKCGGGLSMSVDAPVGLCAELTDQTGRRLVHLVNYRNSEPMQNVKARIRLPEGKKARRVRLASPQRKNDIDLAFEKEDDFVSFIVPEIDIYEIAIIDFDS